MTVRLDKHKGVQVYVGTDGKFFTEDHVHSADTLPELKKLIDGYLKKKRKGGLQPTAVILMDNQLDEDPSDEETILGVSGTNGELRLKGGGTFSSWGGVLVFLPEEFPYTLVRQLGELRGGVKTAEDAIRKIARYHAYRGGRLEADRVIEIEKEIVEALTGERKEGADGDVE